MNNKQTWQKAQSELQNSFSFEKQIPSHSNNCVEGQAWRKHKNLFENVFLPLVWTTKTQSKALPKYTATITTWLLWQPTPDKNVLGKVGRGGGAGKAWK